MKIDVFSKTKAGETLVVDELRQPLVVALWILIGGSEAYFLVVNCERKKIDRCRNIAETNTQPSEKNDGWITYYLPFAYLKLTLKRPRRIEELDVFVRDGVDNDEWGQNK